MNLDEPFIWEVPAFIDHCNRALDHGFGGEISIQGEIASFKVNQGKWVFFDLKEADCNISCFMPLFKLNTQVEDGMKVVLRGSAKVTRWGKLSFTVSAILPVGEGNIKKSFELLKKKLTDEGLFAIERKRPLPRPLQDIGVISSTAAAGYADFVKILNERWGGLHLLVAHTQVQGLPAVDQILRALKYFNEQTDVQVIALLRGGGSADDLAIFNDERLVRAIAASRIPVITGIGHEVDETLADLAADIRASTPSNAAQMLSPDRRSEINLLRQSVHQAKLIFLSKLDSLQSEAHFATDHIRQTIHYQFDKIEQDLAHTRRLLAAHNPDRILSQGYAILSGQIKLKNVVKITTLTEEITAEIRTIKKRE